MVGWREFHRVGQAFLKALEFREVLLIYIYIYIYIYILYLLLNIFSEDIRNYKLEVNTYHNYYLVNSVFIHIVRSSLHFVRGAKFKCRISY